MRGFTRLSLGVLASVFSVSALAVDPGWRYIVVQNGRQVYSGPVTPVDLTYPPDGGAVHGVAAHEPRIGQPLSEAEFAKVHQGPQLMIVPPPVTIGGRAPVSSKP